LDLSRTLQPSLSLWYFHDTIPCEDYTDVRVTIDGGITYTTILSLTKYDAVYGWKQYITDLPANAVNKCVRLVFESMEKSRSGDVTQYIDRIRITAKRDIALSAILTSELSACNLENREWKVVISNRTEPVLDYSLMPTEVTLEIMGTSDVFTQSLHTGVLEGFTSDTITLSTTFNFVPGTYQVKAWFSSVLDDTPNNDTLTTSVTINPDIKVSIHKESAAGCLAGEISVFPTVTVYNSGNMDFSNIELVLQIDTAASGSSPYATFTETISGTIRAKDSVKYTFTNAYIVPWYSVLYVRVTANAECDIALSNNTHEIEECVDVNDLYMISIDNPSSATDRVGSSVEVGITLGNRNELSQSAGLITVVVENSQMVETAKFSEMTAINASSTTSYTFTKTYTVPNDSIYYLTVYIARSDNYPQNDTLRVKRYTEGVGIESQEETYAFALGQNIPNPANNTTRIDYSVPEAGEVVFHVHSISGQVLYSQTLEVKRGMHTLKLNTSSLAAGVYYYLMEYKGQRIVKRMSVR
jgi:hypothetical protein